MADFALDSAAETRLKERACAVAANALRRPAGREVLVLPKTTRLEWSDLTKKFSQPVGVFRHVTDLTLTFNARGEASGWKIEERFATCTDEVLPEGPVEKLARRVEFVSAPAVAEKVESVPLPENRFYQRVIFSDPAGRREVLINPATGVTIGTLPLIGGTASDPNIKEPLPAAWDWVTAYVAKRGGIPVPQKDLKTLFRLTVVGTQRDPSGGQQQQLKLWSHYTDGEVRLAAETGEPLSWSFERILTATGASQTTEAEALALAKNEFREAKEISAPKIEKTVLNGAELMIVTWAHVVGDLRVEADHCSVSINTALKAVAGFARKWRAIPPALFAPPKTTAEEALAEAQRRRAENKIPEQAQAKVLGESVIEVAAHEERPSLVSLYRVWKIGFTTPKNPAFTEIDVDRYTGQTVRVTGW